MSLPARALTVLRAVQGVYSRTGQLELAMVYDSKVRSLAIHLIGAGL